MLATTLTATYIHSLLQPLFPTSTPVFLRGGADDEDEGDDTEEITVGMRKEDIEDYSQSNEQEDGSSDSDIQIGIEVEVAEADEDIMEDEGQEEEEEEEEEDSSSSDDDEDDWASKNIRWLKYQNFGLLIFMAANIL